MSTLTEIEEAIETLPSREQRKLLAHLSAKLEIPETKTTKISLHEQMKDLCGIVQSGISDLGTNKKHLAGLGRPRG